MNGKKVKGIEYNLTFGTSARIVNVFGLFKYKKNNNIYIIYADEINNYNIIYYGYSHVKENSILSMECKEKEAEEIIKEYIYKVTNKDILDNYEIISLDKIEGIEIISSNKIEIKKETLNELTNLTIPQKEEEKKNTKVKKKKSAGVLIFPLIILTVAFLGFYIYTTFQNKESTFKQIICTKEYNHQQLDAQIEEEQTFNFDINDILEKVDTTKLYIFKDEEEYLNFINTGTYIKYMPKEGKEGGWDKDDDKLTYKTIEIERINMDYKKPTEYEEVLSYYKSENYDCEEKIIN